MLQEVVFKEGSAVTRPLAELVPLIKTELAAADEASKEHYARVGAYLLEAKEQMRHGDWGNG